MRPQPDSREPLAPPDQNDGSGAGPSDVDRTIAARATAAAPMPICRSASRRIGQSLRMPTDGDKVINDQITFYRERASEYPQTTQPGIDDRVLACCQASNHCLELASGPGRWTSQLLRVCQRLTAVDSSPEMHARNRALNGDARVEYVVADLFDYQPSAKHDLVFAGFWLSHVPPEHFSAFWSMIAKGLSQGGRVVMVDDGVRNREGVSRFGSDATGDGPDRQLPDGRTFTIVKVAYAPSELESRLADLGWTAEVTLLSSVCYVLEAHR
jgi:SAM-dependent methyltransferase